MDDYAFENQNVRSFDIPIYEMPMTEMVSFVLWSLEGKFPTPGLDSLYSSLMISWTSLPCLRWLLSSRSIRFRSPCQ